MGTALAMLGADVAGGTEPGCSGGLKIIWSGVSVKCGCKKIKRIWDLSSLFLALTHPFLRGELECREVPHGTALLLEVGGDGELSRGVNKLPRGVWKRPAPTGAGTLKRQQLRRRCLEK